jgi:hypothetical protein
VKGRLTATTEADIRRLAIRSKLDIHRRIMSREGQPRRGVLLLASLVAMRRVLLDSKLLADRQPLVIRDLIDLPNSKAVWVAKVLAGIRAVGVAEEVQLLAGVVLMHIHPIPLDAIDAVLNGIHGSRAGMLADADAVAQTPAEDDTLGREIIRGRGAGEVGEIERADLGQTAGDGLGVEGVLVGAAARDDQGAWLRAGHDECPCDQVAVAHVGDDAARFAADGAAAGVVGPGEDGLGGGGVEGLAVVGEGNAVVKLEKLVEVLVCHLEEGDLLPSSQPACESGSSGGKYRHCQ